MEFVTWMNFLKYFFTSSLFLIGQLSYFRCALSVFLFRCLVCCSHIVDGPLFDYRLSKGILNRWRYDLVFPWAVTIAVKLGVELILIFSLSLMFGKNSLVTDPLVDCPSGLITQRNMTLWFDCQQSKCFWNWYTVVWPLWLEPVTRLCWLQLWGVWGCTRNTIYEYHSTWNQATVNFLPHSL
jgi:hypothetical protein